MFEKKLINFIFLILILLILSGCVSEKGPGLTNDLKKVEVKTGDNVELCSNPYYSTTIIDFSDNELAKGLSKTKLIGLDVASQKKFEQEFELKGTKVFSDLEGIGSLNCLELLALHSKKFDAFSMTDLRNKLTNLIVLDLEGSNVIDVGVVYDLPKLELVNLKGTNISENTCGDFTFDLPNVKFICPELSVRGGIVVEVWDVNGFGPGVEGANVEVSINGKIYSAKVDVNPENGLGGNYGVAELFIDWPAPENFIIKVSKDGYKTQEVTWSGLNVQTVYLNPNN